MRNGKCLFCVISLLCIGLIGCGGSSGSSGSSTATTPGTTTGNALNLQMAAKSTTTGSTYQIISNLLQSSNKNSLSGTSQFANSSGFNTPLPVQGWLDSNNNITLTGIDPTSGGTLTVSGTVATGGSTLSGNYTFTDATTGNTKDKGTVTGNTIPSAAGTRGGNFSSGNSGVGVSMNLTQTLDTSDAMFKLTGPVTITGLDPSCGASSQSLTFNGSVAGTAFTGTLGNMFQVSGTRSLDGKTLTGTYSVLSGPCAGYSDRVR